MTFVVVGAGAIGSAIAARLAHGGQDVTLVVRDAARAALIERDGVTCEEAGETITGHPAVSDRVPDTPADVLVLAVKAAALPGVAATLPAAIGRDTLVVPLVNGIPWWFRLGRADRAEPLRAVDPDGTLTRRFAPAQIVGSVVYTTAMMQAPAHVTVTQRQSLVIGAIGSDSRDKVAALARVLAACGIDVTVSDRIVDAVWAKAALNLATNPLSVVAEAGLGDLCSDARLVPIVSNILDETWRVAARYNACPPMTRDEMLGRGRLAGAFRTSMLEDYLKGRPLELSSIADAVFEMADEIGMDLPVSRAIVDMARFRAGTRFPEKQA
ncbi:2-dehydropantoate 2-reductase [Novosphingobium sp. NBM11]|uniref:ketopantoate reductase family protein n=1 Tax=Novosphingobium sp. NBM11 TaxID=2596914 RepID=UPI00086EB65F|nr:2-dehydropantoate 2-reductase [Novosphingobium sp. NBM11]MBF5092731.1 2-dehydropantoate 2-reductase [Novosphingobium sp. NBM11]ODU72230.1 MAG: hypothetical protein ABT11_01270 [Novosphingobium sp. SCN 66-18]